MNRKTKNLLLAASGVLIACFLAAHAAAQAFPAKPIRLVVGYPPGGSGDFLTRVVADELGKELGIAVVTDNRPGAGATLASDLVAKAPADGYTLLNSSHHSVNKALYKKLSYDPDHDFAAITQVAAGPVVICVNNEVPVKNLRELIAYAKANPGKLFSAASGNGSAPHLGAVQFESVAGVHFTTVQFKGGGPAALSLLAGDTQVMFATPPTVMGFIHSGRMRALAVSSRLASAAISGIPGAEEAGLPGYDYRFAFGLYAPAGTPQPVIRRLFAAAVKGLSKPEVREKIAAQGMDAAPSVSVEAFEAQLRAEASMWERLIKESGARVE
jgi:tripartite-type tricarboxylate transporter receptor subunit TctC